MTDPARLAAEKWLAEQFTTALMAAWSVPAVDGKPTPTEECARIAADFAERLAKAERVLFLEQMNLNSERFRLFVDENFALPWAEAMKEDE